MAVGMRMKKKGLFGAMKPDDYGTPGIGDGMMQPGMGMEPEKERSGPNWGGIGRNVLGNVGDAIAQYYGVTPVYRPMMQQQQQAEMIAEAQRQRALQAAQQNEEWYRREDYKASMAGQEPPKPGSFEWYQNASAQERAVYDQYNPFVVSTGQGPVAVPRGTMGGSAAPQAGAIEDGYMFKGGDPSDQRNWEPVPDQRQHTPQSQGLLSSTSGESTEDYMRRMGYR